VIADGRDGLCPPCLVLDVKVPVINLLFRSSHPLVFSPNNPDDIHFSPLYECRPSEIAFTLRVLFSESASHTHCMYSAITDIVCTAPHRIFQGLSCQDRSTPLQFPRPFHCQCQLRSCHVPHCLFHGVSLVVYNPDTFSPSRRIVFSSIHTSPSIVMPATAVNSTNAQGSQAPGSPAPSLHVAAPSRPTTPLQLTLPQGPGSVSGPSSAMTSSVTLNTASSSNPGHDKAAAQRKEFHEALVDADGEISVSLVIRWCRTPRPISFRSSTRMMTPGL
jgi:hypothetical protein